MFNAPDSQSSTPVDVFDLIPDEHRAEAAAFFRALTLEADVRGVTIAEALADALRPHLRLLRRGLGVEAFEEHGLTITDARGNRLAFALTEPGTRHLRAS